MQGPDVTGTNNRYWHVGREVPVALILSLVVLFVGQTVGAAWWVATTSNRIEQLERQIVLIAPQTERIIRLEEKIGVVQQGINELKMLLGKGR
jgi:Tfp pilus assembly protein PilN